MGPQAKVIDLDARRFDRIERVYRFGFPKPSRCKREHPCVTFQFLIRASGVPDAWLGNLVVSIAEANGRSHARVRPWAVNVVKGETDESLLHVFVHLDPSLKPPRDPDRAFVRIRSDRGESLIFPYPTDEFGTSRLPEDASRAAS